ncbi:MAG TPA: hypothetical protein VGP13_01045 [Candidatus Paceibacterota bacterium]|nr:hypothetical protein [Candidatus Paceibacterota bacterium]
MEGRQVYADAYRDSLAVRKLKAGARRIVVADKDGCIQPFPHPVADPPKKEIAAGWEIRRITKADVFVESSAQVVDLSADSATFARSRARGLNRPAPKIRLPNGKITDRPEDVEEWMYLLNPDLFVGFGTGIYPMQDDHYLYDWEYDEATGGSTWRPEFFFDLDRAYPDGSYRKHLGLIDQDGAWEAGDVDVAPLAFRAQWKHFSEKEREEFWLSFLSWQLKGLFPNAVLVDESNPAAGHFTTYGVSTFAQKHMAMERAGNMLSFHSGVAMSEVKIVKIGDSPTDVRTMLDAFQGAGEVTGVVAANSRISKAIHNNEDHFAGIALAGSPNHPEVPGRYYRTDTEGVLVWKGTGHERERTIILADYAPWSRGMGCVESSLACLKYLGY